ncbi:hypothetical protein Q3G72_009394 [Acer saccharum]|nr:hypothetical protein Q3G72_009394 [Acer saccharum]
MDARMEGQYPSEAALQAAQLSLRCLELDPRSRPSMKEVVEVLKEIEAQASHLHHEEPKLCQKKKLRTIMDVCMKGQYTTTAAFQAAELTQKCLDSIRENRPSMKEVVEVLKEIEEWRKKQTTPKFRPPHLPWPIPRT